MPLSATNVPGVRVTLSNCTGKLLDLVLEPWGEVYTLGDGETKDLLYRDDPKNELGVTVADGEVKVWAQGFGILDVADGSVEE